MPNLSDADPYLDGSGAPMIAWGRSLAGPERHAGDSGDGTPSPNRTPDRSWVRAFVRANQRAVTYADRVLPARLRVVGGDEFRNKVVPAYLFENAVICDVGGGKRPLVSVDEKRRLGLRIVGLDIDQEELLAAPVGCYDAITVVDLTRYRGDENVDLVLCKSTLEHVQDAEAALCGIASLLKPGGRALLFLPCRHAVFARLNLILPERIKCRLLFAAFPEKAGKAGFKAYYDQASIGEYRELADHVGLIVREDRAYFISSYFSFFLPLWVAWRIYALLNILFRGRNACENFLLILEKPSA